MFLLLLYYMVVGLTVTCFEAFVHDSCLMSLMTTAHVEGNLLGNCLCSLPTNPFLLSSRRKVIPLWQKFLSFVQPDTRYYFAIFRKTKHGLVYRPFSLRGLFEYSSSFLFHIWQVLLRSLLNVIYEPLRHCKVSHFI